VNECVEATRSRLHQSHFRAMAGGLSLARMTNRTVWMVDGGDVECVKVNTNWVRSVAFSSDVTDCLWLGDRSYVLDASTEVLNVSRAHDLLHQSHFRAMADGLSLARMTNRYGVDDRRRGADVSSHTDWVTSVAFSWMAGRLSLARVTDRYGVDGSTGVLNVSRGHTDWLDQSHFRAMADGLSLARMTDLTGVMHRRGVLNVLEGHSSGFISRISSDGRRIVSGSCDRSYCVDGSRGVLNVFDGHTDWVNQPHFRAMAGDCIWVE